jgi:nifR3 family TIM-barrel protein
MTQPREFSEGLKLKIKRVRSVMKPIELGSLSLPSHLIQAPMAGICSVPYRLLMEELGAAATVSELVSCHGINYGNDRTLNMLKLHERESLVGLQLFGDDPLAMAKAAKVMEAQKPKFIDINMGCPVKKVVSKGGGSALLQNPSELKVFFSTIKDAINVPLTIKIRTGWDEESINAHEVIEIAKACEIEWVAVHGRTRRQQYTGEANWNYLEKLGATSSLPIIGNGDLHTPLQVSKKSENTNCQALMIARGALRNPFIFLESFIPTDSELADIYFTGEDYFEIIERLYFYTDEAFDRERLKLVQLRKFLAWFSAGFPGAAKFRNQIFETKEFSLALKVAERFFCHLPQIPTKQIPDGIFMSSGHG